MVRAADYTNPPADSLPETGSDQSGYAYMWCTQDTMTYTFFSQLEFETPPTDQYIFRDAVNGTMVQYADQADIWIPDGGFTSNVAAKNIQVHFENSKGGKLTWGIANAALRGINEFYQAYSDQTYNNLPIIFQVNDGAWGTIGIGYVAYLRPSDGQCILQIKGGKETPCSKLWDLIKS